MFYMVIVTEELPLVSKFSNQIEEGKFLGRLPFLD
jgi:hypothetical protein